ncbi:MAG: chromosome segregation protein SMC [Sedimentisphaerales bacterium]|nr:chromosome segregation protein SMC [Sedimentisphaerales bacterium]
MQLKKITVCGFKSFADKTEFEFGDGVTVVVGPNGCGKSNIVDAVKWVLGEQSAKSLRGGQMLDVIFNGTTNRKSMGMAEVTLTFGNTRNLLNVDHDEVAVTRRLFRSGESQYLLNGKACRLKDIRELFMDTGVGADAYSIIEQGKVEVLLQSSAEDRRAVFEEAAGISRYKARKKESLRKLDRTEQNLLRLTDIIGELEKQLRSIRYQAGKARNYQVYTTRLKELQLNQFLAEYHKFSKEAEAGKDKLTQLQDELIAITTGLEKTQTRLSVLDHSIDEVDRQLRQTEGELLQCTSQIGTQQDRIEYGHKRCAEIEELMNRGRGQIRSLRQQITKLQEDGAEARQENEQAQKELEVKQAELNQLQDARQERALELNEYRAQLEDEKSGLIDIVRRTAQIHNEINSLDLRKDNLAGQKNRLHDRSGKISAEMESLFTERAQLDAKLEEIQVLLTDSQQQLEGKRQQLAQLSEERLSCNEDLAAAKEYRSGLMSRRQLLADMESKLEGVDAGVKQVLQAKAEDGQQFYYVKGMLAELLRADVQYATIIEAALGEKSQYLIATSGEAVLQDCERLRELSGRVRMLCLDRVPAYTNGYDFAQHEEVQARAIDLVSYPEDCERLAYHLLGKTILVDSIESALRLAEVVPSGYRWVSLAGEVLEADGTLHLGPQTGQAGLISRKSELRQLEEDLVDTDERIRDLQNQAEQYASQAGHLEKNLQELRTAIYESNTEKVETSGRRDRLEHDIDRLKQEQPIIASELAGLEEQIGEAMELQASSRQNLVDLESINEQRKEQISALEETIRQLQSEDQQKSDEITEMKVSLGQTQQKRLALRERIAAMDSQLQQLKHNMETLTTDLTNSQHNLETAQRGILAAESQISQLFLTRQQQQEQSHKLRDEREELAAEKEELTETAARQNRQRSECQESLHDAQMHLNETQLRLENLVGRAQEQVGLDLAEYYQRVLTAQEESQAKAALTDGQEQEEPAQAAAEQAEGEKVEAAAEQAEDEEEQGPANLIKLGEPVDWEAVSQEIADLKGKIERLGNVNVNAISEQEELEKRAEYLNGQLQDLEESKRQLEQLIEKINTESEQRFRANFEAIQENFAELFRKLFGGGRAEIVLEDPDNILECGIEIVARPPGKQLRSISLMSGGEKTMTAVALLLGIFKSKPSPFCLLDEVDAALDEANVERFTLVVKEFLEDSQFVIITHSRRTMSVADVIYGITMQEQGVSKKVSVQFNSAEAVA